MSDCSWANTVPVSHDRAVVLLNSACLSYRVFLYHPREHCSCEGMY
jgi:hypothetical protein